MNKNQIAQLNSFQTTQLVLENGSLIWEGNLAFKNNVTEFNVGVAEVFKYKDMQVTDLGGAHAYKVQARDVMATKSITIRSAVQNYASDANLVMLYKQINLMPSKLTYGDQQKVLSNAQRIESIARKNLAELAPYKVEAEQLDDYLLAITTYKNALPLVDGIYKGRKTATQKLAEACKKTRDIVEQKLRRGATQFMETAPDFYSDLLFSFEINKLPTHFTEFDMLMVNEATGEAVSGVKVTAKSDKGEMLQFSNPVGEVDFKQFEPGYWNLTFELAGFETVTKTAVKADLGKKLELGTIAMVPVAI